MTPFRDLILIRIYISMCLTVLWHSTFIPCSETTPLPVIVNYVSILVCMRSLFRSRDKIKCTHAVNRTSASEIILNGMHACELVAGKKNCGHLPSLLRLPYMFRI